MSTQALSLREEFTSLEVIFFSALDPDSKVVQISAEPSFFFQLELGSSLKQHIPAKFHLLHSSQFPHLSSPQAHPLHFSSGNSGPLRDCNQTGKDEIHKTKANTLLSKLDKATP